MQTNWQDSGGTYPAVPVVGDDKMGKCAGSQMTTWLSGEFRRITDRENVQGLQGRGDVACLTCGRNYAQIRGTVYSQSEALWKYSQKNGSWK